MGLGTFIHIERTKELRELFRLEICIPLKNLIIFRNMVVLKL